MQSCEAGTNWSAMTVEFILDVVTHSGFSSTEGTWVLAVVSVVVPLTRLAGGSGRPEVDGQSGRGLGLLVDRLVDRAALVAGEDVLQADEGGVLTGGRERLGLDVQGLQVGDDRAPFSSLGIRAALMLLWAVNACWNSVSAVGGSQVPAGVGHLGPSSPEANYGAMTAS